jgi:hypothetical protein
MVRAQIQFTEAQLQALRTLSAKTGRSIADIARDAVTMYLGRHSAPAPELVAERAIEIAGQFSSGQSDISSDHDRYLAEAFGS